MIRVKIDNENIRENGFVRCDYQILLNVVQEFVKVIANAGKFEPNFTECVEYWERSSKKTTYLSDIVNT